MVVSTADKGNRLANNRLIVQSDAKRLMNYYLRNADFFKPWEPIFGPERNQASYWYEQMSLRLALQNDGQAYYWVAVDRYSDEIIAHCSITQIFYGAFQAAYMGYAVDERYQGKKVVKSLYLDVIDHAFNELKLNRLMANYMPRNKRSAALLKSLGFQKEGYAERYIKINGKWEDHVLNAFVNPSSI